MKKLLQKGFTLIELLIVIGILGILVVAVLLTLNPAEAQKKARDAQRLKDLATVQTIVDQAINDGITINCGTTCTSAAASACASGSTWIDTNPDASLCPYASKLPLDPLQGRTANFINDSGTTTGAASAYFVKSSNVDYSIGVRLESLANRTKATGDGGANTCIVEVFSGSASNFAGTCATP